MPVLLPRSLPAATAVLFLTVAVFGGAQAQRPPKGPRLQATLRCDITENSQQAAGEMTVTNGKNVTTTALCGTEPMRLAPGQYDVILRLNGALDAPEHHRVISLGPRSAQRITADFQTGFLEVIATRQNKRTMAPVTLFRDGQRIARFATGIRVRLSAGRYSLEIGRGSAKRTVEDVLITREHAGRLDVEL